jgi:hypothetical protein
MMNNYIHKNLASGRWSEMSLAEQFGNIGSEVSRAGKQLNKDKNLFNKAVERALELFDLTMMDKRWKGRLKEIGRAKEVFCDATLGGKEYGSTFQNIQKYFDYFGMAANLRKNSF